MIVNMKPLLKGSCDYLISFASYLKAVPPAGCMAISFRVFLLAAWVGLTPVRASLAIVRTRAGFEMRPSLDRVETGEAANIARRAASMMTKTLL